MASTELILPIGQPVSLPGLFPTPVVLEAARRLGAGREWRVRPPDGGLDEVAGLPRTTGAHQDASPLLDEAAAVGDPRR